MFVSPSFNLITVLISRLANVGSPPNPAPEMLCTPVSLGGGDRGVLQSVYRFGGFNPFQEYIKRVHVLFEELQVKIEAEIPKRLTGIEASGIDATQRGSTWTYMTTDQPYGNWMDRALRDFFRKRR